MRYRQRAIRRSGSCGLTALLIASAMNQPLYTMLLAFGLGVILCLALLGGRP